MKYHMWSGYTILGLLAFRITWGFIGGQNARFSTFVRGPGTVLRYAQTLLHRDAPKYMGHNPLGGWSVLGMLTTLTVQAATGLFANDDIFIKGPLYHWINKATSDGLTRIHRLNQEFIILLVIVHVIAVFFYLIIKHENLIRPMFTGCKNWHGEGHASANPLGTATLIAGLVAVGVYLLVR